MAQNPAVFPCPAETWTQIATGAEKGLITILEPRASYRITYRVSPSVPPATQQEIDESPKIQSLEIDIESDAPIDVYVYAVRGKDGEVTVYLQ